MAQMADLRSRAHALEAETVPDENGDYPEGFVEQLGELQGQHREIDQTVAARGGFTAEQKAVAGCIVTIGFDGKADVRHGLVRPEDMKEANKLEGRTGGASAGGGTKRKDKAQIAREDAGISSAALELYLEHQRCAIVKATLMHRPELAFDVATYQMLVDVSSLGWHEKAIDMRVDSTAAGPNLATEDWYAGNPGPERRREQWAKLTAMMPWLPASGHDWFRVDHAAMFAEFRSLGLDVKQQVFAFCVASGIKPQLAHSPGGGALLESVIVDLAPGFHEFRPPAAMFWNKLSKPVLLQVMAEVCAGECSELEESLAKMKKGELVEYVEGAFTPASSDHKALPAAVRTRIKEWVPMGFIPKIEGPGADGEEEDAA